MSFYYEFNLETLEPSFFAVWIPVDCTTPPSEPYPNMGASLEVQMWMRFFSDSSDVDDPNVPTGKKDGSSDRVDVARRRATVGLVWSRSRV